MFPYDTIIATTYDLTQGLLKPRPVSPIPIIFDSIYNLLLELFDIFHNSILSEPRNYLLEDILNDNKPTYYPTENRTLTVLGDFSRKNVSPTDPVLTRVEMVLDTDSILEYER